MQANKLNAIQQDALRLSSGTLGALTGLADYNTLDAVQALFVAFVDRRVGEFATWTEAWEKFKWLRHITALDPHSRIVIDESGELVEQAGRSFSSRITAKSEIAPPFHFGGRWWVCTGQTFGPLEAGVSHRIAHCREVVRWTDYDDDPPAWRKNPRHEYSGRIVNTPDNPHDLRVITRRRLQIHHDHPAP